MPCSTMCGDKGQSLCNIELSRASNTRQLEISSAGSLGGDDAVRTAEHQSSLPCGSVHSSCLWTWLWLADWARWLAEPLPAAVYCDVGQVVYVLGRGLRLAMPMFTIVNAGSLGGTRLGDGQ